MNVVYQRIKYKWLNEFISNIYNRENIVKSYLTIVNILEHVIKLIQSIIYERSLYFIFNYMRIHYLHM